MKKHLPKFILIAIFWLIGVIHLHNLNKKIDRDRAVLDKKYLEITTMDAVRGEITNVYHGNLSLYRNDVYHAYITLDDGRRFSIAGDIAGPGHSPTIDEVVEKGDSLLKRPNQSSFTIIKLDSQMTASRYEFKFRQ